MSASASQRRLLVELAADAVVVMTVPVFREGQPAVAVETQARETLCPPAVAVLSSSPTHGPHGTAHTRPSDQQIVDAERDGLPRRYAGGDKGDSKASRQRPASAARCTGTTAVQEPFREPVMNTYDPSDYIVYV